MHALLIDELRRKELSILAGLRVTAPYRRLEAVRHMLSLYDDTPPVGAQVDALLAKDGRHEVGVASAPLASVIALPGPRADAA